MVRVTRRRFIGSTAAAAGSGAVASVAVRMGLPLAAAANLPTRPFGRSGVNVCLVGLGGGGRFFEPVPDDEAGAELVRNAVERGVSFIETAAGYGPPSDVDRSERRIGMAMKTHRSRVFLETKIDARDYDGAMREMERSLKLLQTDRIDFMLHHNLGRGQDLEVVAGPNGAEKAIRRMVDQKIVRFRGFSTHSPAFALAAIPRLEPDGIQAPINATRTPDFEAEVLPLAKSRGIAMVAMKVVGHGFFLKEAIGGGLDSRAKSDKNPELHRYSPPPDAFERPYPSPDEFLRYALSLPITTALIGLDSVATLRGIVAVASTYQALGAVAMSDIQSKARAFAGTGYWIPRQRT